MSVRLMSQAATSSVFELCHAGEAERDRRLGNEREPQLAQGESPWIVSMTSETKTTPTPAA
jgi:hypothetical protein